MLLLTAAAVTACGSGERATPATTTLPDEVVDTSAPAPSTTVPITVTTVPGRPRTVTTLPVDISGGQARISGTVVGPGGIVPNAVIRVERLLGAEVSTLTVTSTASGSFSLPSVRGGHYRMRAWRVPDLLMLQPEAFFLAAEEQKYLDLRLIGVGELNLRVATDPAVLPREAPFSIVITAYTGEVTPDGTLQGTSRNGLAVQFVVGQNLGLQGPDKGTTDAVGMATFRAKCTGAGPAAADVIAGAVRLALALPDCPP